MAITVLAIGISAMAALVAQTLNGTESARYMALATTLALALFIPLFIRLDVTPHGPDSPERYRELADAVDAHCPVLDLFTHATPVERRLAVAA